MHAARCLLPLSVRWLPSEVGRVYVVYHGRSVVWVTVGPRTDWALERDFEARLHGPYYQWTYKVAGKTRTLRLSAEQARLCQKWVRNHKRLKRLGRQMEQLSLKETDRALGAISRL